MVNSSIRHHSQRYCTAHDTTARHNTSLHNTRQHDTALHHTTQGFYIMGGHQMRTEEGRIFSQKQIIEQLRKELDAARADMARLLQIDEANQELSELDWQDGVNQIWGYCRLWYHSLSACTHRKAIEQFCRRVQAAEIARHRQTMAQLAAAERTIQTLRRAQTGSRRKSRAATTISTAAADATEPPQIEPGATEPPQSR